jgi:hypothetical protein
MPRRPSKPVTRRTAARRAKQYQASVIARAARRHTPKEPETIAQARIWDRKKNRYLIAGLCHPCSCQAAWGHALGFQKIHDPCAECQPIVNAFPNSGPRGSKWRKCLIKLEYMDPAEVAEIFA